MRQSGFLTVFFRKRTAADEDFTIFITIDGMISDKCQTFRQYDFSQTVTGKKCHLPDTRQSFRKPDPFSLLQKQNAFSPMLVKPLGSVIFVRS